MKVKYAQYNEESIFENLFSNKIGFLCDIGAADGIRYSNSRYLIEKGWKAFLIEPNPNSYQRLRSLYEGNDRVTTIDVCCYCEDIGVINFYCDTYDGFGHISTMSEDFKSICENMYEPQYVTHKVKCEKTSNVFSRNLIPRKIDFLSIDCEGVDFEVLLGIDFSFYDIDVLCIENRDQRIHEFMDSKNYKKIQSTEGNVFYGK